MKLYHYWHYRNDRWRCLYPSTNLKSAFLTGEEWMSQHKLVDPIAVTKCESESHGDFREFTLEYCRDTSPDLLFKLLGERA